MRRRDDAAGRSPPRRARRRPRARRARGRDSHRLGLPLRGASRPGTRHRRRGARRALAGVAASRARLPFPAGAAGHRLAAHLRRRPRDDVRPRPLRASRPRGRGLLPARPRLAPAGRERAREAGVARGRLRARGGGRDAPVPPLRREPAPRAQGVDAARRDQPRPRGPRDERGLPARDPRGALPLQPRLPGGEPGLGASSSTTSRSVPATMPRAPGSRTTGASVRPRPASPSRSSFTSLPSTRPAWPRPRSSTARSPSGRPCAGARRSCPCSPTGR